jgi:hypothetical protein
MALRSETVKASAQPAGLDLPADLTLMGAMFGVIADIRRTLTPEARERCPGCSAIGGYLDERIPGPHGGLPSYVPDETDTHPVSVLARRLAGGELFTELAAETAGEAIVAAVVRDTDTPMPRRERELLMAAAADRVNRRRGELRTAATGKLCARVTSVVIPARFPPDATDELEDTGTPLGSVLKRLGGWREPLWTWPFCNEDTVINSGARLWLPSAAGRIPVGLATELVCRLDWWAAA